MGSTGPVLSTNICKIHIDKYTYTFPLTATHEWWLHPCLIEDELHDSITDHSREGIEWMKEDRNKASEFSLYAYIWKFMI